MSDIFNSSVDSIEQTYQAYGYHLGWRFLNCSKEILNGNPEIALITANPGGDSPQPDHPSESCENGHSYLTEQWGSSGPGRSPLQVQLQGLFNALARISDKAEGGRALLENSLSGYFIPFRSPRLKDLAHADDARLFGSQLWSQILASTKPKLLISIDKDTYTALSKIVPETYGVDETEERSFNTGWGEYKADVKLFDSGKVTLMRLPHLSTFKLFGRPACKPYVDDILKFASSAIASPTASRGLWD